MEKGAVNIYISPFEHNAVTRTLHHFEEQGKIKVTQLTVSKDMVYDLAKKSDISLIRLNLILL